jgi:hypothetical protein
MNQVVVLLAVTVVCFAADRAADAQEPPPPIGPFVVDIHGVVPMFPSDPQTAASRGLVVSDTLPGSGLGLTAGGHFYFAKLLAVTFGVGGELAVGRSHVAGQTSSPGITDTFTAVSPVLSLNFGSGNGWSYLSFGYGETRLSIVRDGVQPLPVDEERKATLSYGGGARWFIRKRLAFSLDVRMYEIAAGTPESGNQGTPHTKLLVIGAGISVKLHAPRREDTISYLPPIVKSR